SYWNECRIRGGEPGELIVGVDTADDEVRLLVPRRPGQRPDETPFVRLVRPAVEPVDRPAEDIDPIAQVEAWECAKKCEWRKSQDIGEGGGWGGDGVGTFEAGQGVESPGAEVEAAGGEDRKMHLSEDLRQVEPPEMVVDEGVVEQAEGLREQP